MALGRREKNLHSSIRGSRILAAIGIGIVVGCVFAYLFPHGFFSTNQPTQIRTVSDSNIEVCNFFYILYFLDLFIAVDLLSVDVSAKLLNVYVHNKFFVRDLSECMLI